MLKKSLRLRGQAALLNRSLLLTRDIVVLRGFPKGREHDVAGAPQNLLGEGQDNVGIWELRHSQNSSAAKHTARTSL